MPRTRDRSARKSHATATRDAPARTRGSVESGASTREAVLQVARQLLVDEGYANFSIRRVADAAGITVGNLTYHFPSKRELVRALVASLLTHYGVAKERLHAEIAAHPDGLLERLIEWVMRDAAAADTLRLFRELWAMALHDPVAARAVDDFYTTVIDALARILRAAYPALDDQAALELSHMITVITEGTSVIYGTSPDREVPLDRMIRTVSWSLEQAVHARLAAPRGRTRRASSR